METFHSINKGNGAESKYDIGLKSHKHGWSPKLGMRYFNMGSNNAYKVYEWIVDKYTTGRRYYDMGECINEAAHAFLQREAPMCKQVAKHPEHAKDISQMFDNKVGRKLRIDAKGYQCSRSHGHQAATPTIANSAHCIIIKATILGVHINPYPVRSNEGVISRAAQPAEVKEQDKEALVRHFHEVQRVQRKKGYNCVLLQQQKGQRYSHVPYEAPHDAWRIN